MTGHLKRNAEKIVAHFRSIKDQPWLPESQRWWPGHLFHFTDLTNAVKILGDGKLVSRSELERTGGLVTDIASPEVISSTGSRWKEYVRLYFRPRTPTQYRNEGFRPVGQREMNAHCPVPISFVFDAGPILTSRPTMFSDGNLAAGAEPGNTAEYFQSLPFEKIYHDRSLWRLSDSEKRNIIYHRHAEVIVPNYIDLSSLKLISCRSQAEFETLVYSLPWRVRRKWSRHIGVSRRSMLFFGQWPFLEKADLSISSNAFSFNPSEKTGPFHAKIELTETKTKKIYRWQKNDFHASGTLSLDLSNLANPENYVVKFSLDGHLAYENRYLDDSALPF